MKKITIIGAGNLGTALARGMQKSGQYEVCITGRKAIKLEKFKSEGISVAVDNRAAIMGADYVVFCLQPTQLMPELKKLSDVFTKNQVVISTATGVPISEMAEVLAPEISLVRSMPNTAAAIGRSMTCLATEKATEEEMKEVQALFECIGATLVIDEQLMQAATVLGASGIAFFLRYIRAATQGGIQMGFHPHEAQFIAVQTALGAAGLIAEHEVHPESEIDKVTTPRGCTIEGLNEMEHQGLSSAVIKGLMASYNKINNIR